MSPSTDLITDKVKLIYEFNGNSPLFARVASAEIERGNYLDAVKILERGLAVHQQYPTALLILALAKAYSGDGDTALNYALEASRLINCDETYESYKKKIDAILAERNSLADVKRPGFGVDNNQESGDPEFNLDDRLDVLAEELKKAKIIPKEVPETAPPSTSQFNGKIVSETLAEIYFTQKNYSGAIAIYSELILIKPEKFSFYENRIEEIKTAMNSWI
jgi:tetratricopeptide (TPR) repeat protein